MDSFGNPDLFLIMVFVFIEFLKSWKIFPMTVIFDIIHRLYRIHLIGDPRIDMCSSWGSVFFGLTIFILYVLKEFSYLYYFRFLF